MNEHTPGPWLFDEESEAITSHKRIASGKTRIATVTLGWSEPFESEQTANARLIAAAPELLEALEKIIEMNRQWALDECGDAKKAENMDCVKVARAAIARATGDE